MTFREAIDRRTLVFDGAMGTQIQRHQLKAAEFGGKEGANDLLTLTRPDLIEDIHARYFAVGVRRRRDEHVRLLAPEARRVRRSATAPTR